MFSGKRREHWHSKWTGAGIGFGAKATMLVLCLNVLMTLLYEGVFHTCGVEQVWWAARVFILEIFSLGEILYFCSVSALAKVKMICSDNQLVFLKISFRSGNLYFAAFEHFITLLVLWACKRKNLSCGTCSGAPKRYPFWELSVSGPTCILVYPL